MATPDLSLQEIKDLVMEAYRSFYLDGFRTNFLMRGGKRMAQNQFNWFWKMGIPFLITGVPSIFKFVEDLRK